LKSLKKDSTRTKPLFPSQCLAFTLGHSWLHCFDSEEFSEMMANAVEGPP
jgi:hypothetical protein